LSDGVFTALVTEACGQMLRNVKRADIVVETLTIYFLKPVPIDSVLTLKPHLLEAGRMYAKIDVDVFNGKQQVGQALLMGQLIERREMNEAFNRGHSLR